MEEKSISSWRDLTLLQIGSLLKDFMTNPEGRIYLEWLFLTDEIKTREIAIVSKKKWNGFSVNTTRVLLTYFFTFAAVVHKQFFFPGENPELKKLVQEYHLDLLGNLISDIGFEFYFSNMIPHRVSEDAANTTDGGPNYYVGDHYVDDLGFKWLKRTHEDCAKICWNRILCYLAAEEGAPTFRTRAEDAFAWLERRNQEAYTPIFKNKNGTEIFLFNRDDECKMKDVYPRFLQQLDDWNPHCMKLWTAYRSGVQRHLQELSAILEIPLETAKDGNGHE